MRNIWRVIRFIWQHPLAQRQKGLAFGRLFKWQINSRLHPYPVVYPYVEESVLVIEKGMTGATGNVYVGLHEFEDMGFLLHYLREDELFVDIGANVGSYTVLASAVVKARSIAIEPIPTTFERLRSNIFHNRLEQKVQAYNVGVGSRKTIMKFTRHYDTVNHAIADEAGASDYVEVPVETLDNVLEGRRPILIKIDVEGFEQEVLKGAVQVLDDQQVQAIIIELNGSGARYGFSEKAIHEMLLSKQFSPYQYNPFTRKMEACATYNNGGNTIYVRDVKKAIERVSTARKFKIFNQWV